MTSEKTATTAALRTPALRAPALEPVPMDGCPICTAAVAQREAARRLGSVVSLRSTNVVISQHPHRRVTDVKEVAA
ncbi:hypothetical protein ACWD4G_21925 [Streptomyces sp. NPDC002643]